MKQYFRPKLSSLGNRLDVQLMWVNVAKGIPKFVNIKLKIVSFHFVIIEINATFLEQIA